MSNQNNLSEYAFSMHSKFRESGYITGHLLYMHLALNEFVLHSPLGVDMKHYFKATILHIIRVGTFRCPLYADGVGWWS